MRPFVNFLAIFLILLPVLANAQSYVVGNVTDENGEPLPYVNIYVENSSIGTTSNPDGAYTLKLNPGSYSIVFQFIGYKTVREKVNLRNKNVKKNIVMNTEQYAMPEVVISANAEDPAYAIIRKAQAKRKYYKKLQENFECDAYVRGFNKMYNAPEKILGVEVGDMDGALDSTRQGVVYLSESVSKLYSKGGKKKEVMFSSKISGDDQGYSFNSAKEMEFDFYSNMVDVNKDIVNPIGNAAMSYYKFKLEGAQYDDFGQLVNKIKVTPKNEYSPAFFGYIYINEDLWNLNSIELGLTKKSLQFDFIDSLILTQTFIPVEKDRWMPFSNIVKFRLGAFGFDVGGNFACVYSNYVLDNVNDEIFNNEVFKVESEANQRSEIYWDSIRPIPLTVEERVDYVRKDSIRIVRESPEYLDSIDRENNKFKIGNILSGYDHQNSKKFENWNIQTPISNLDLNTIQGFSGGFGFNYSKSYNKIGTRRLTFNASFNYGLSEKVLRPKFSIHYLTNRKNNLRFRIEGGRDLSQFNRLNPISGRLNAALTYIFRRNYMKAYDKKYLTFLTSRNLGSIFRGQFSLNYEDRSSVENNYDNSLFYKNSRTFTPNLGPFETHQALILRLSLRVKIGEQVWSYPDRDFRIGSDWPTLWLYYKKGLNFLGSDVDYDLIHATLNKSYDIGLLGTFDFYIHGGYFINQPNKFVDYIHFMGNQTHIGNPFNYNRRFLLLPYYSHSDNKSFVQFHLHHNFRGALLGRLPVFKQLGWRLAGGFKYLDTGNLPSYQEFHVGIDNIGWKVFRLFRVDAVWSNWDNALEVPSEGTRFGVVIGLKVGL